MTSEQAKSLIDATKYSFDAQRKQNQDVLDSQLDAGDRLILRKAAETVTEIAKAQAVNPQ